MKKIAVSCSLLILLMMAGCSQANSDDGYTAGELRAVNHVEGQGINGFSVNGYHVPGLGGGYCCIMLPEKWTPDFKVRVDWEVDPHTAPSPPSYKDWDNYLVWEKQLKSSFKQHNAIVNIPQYGKERCGLTVHFLPCNKVKVTTACSGYGTSGYPIKETINMKEPATCPVK
ncbi:DUF3304 domain-containing protein [Pantoea trifolii]|uniref:DUF3304 domain-containing protein n=1 Tax=Pantoea trifolii TaxID=2968030 RepID=A0ABT1VH96_9GAMM|nr:MULTISPECIES: DUF3304 domain-containing protein [unclassified Pantoea]MCQ8226904.1 DUF3304 domain-containing protein [Pantoea sp. MMK2]MCQ8235076.1 DUF3304 domain-containing protein [Pantoea sp. MMK3]